jgi:hypothetical protein
MSFFRACSVNCECSLHWTTSEQALSYLVNRPDTPAKASTAVRTPNASSTFRGTMSRLRSGSFRGTPTSSPGISVYSHQTASASEPRLTRSANRHTIGSVKRAGTPAVEFLDTTEFGSPRSKRTYGSDYESELILTDDGGDNDGAGGDGFDDLENVRACCDGKHSLHELSLSVRKRHLRYHVRRPPTGSHMDEPPPKLPLLKPVTSRASSRRS